LASVCEEAASDIAAVDREGAMAEKTVEGK
jgi:hypothetical protein